MAKLKVVEGHGIAPNTLLNNDKASMAAEGLYTWIQSKPNGWKFSAERIALSHPDSLYSIKKALKELEELKYLVRNKYQDEYGKRDREYVLHLSPLVDTPPTVTPTADSPTAVTPTADIQPILVNKNSKQDIVNKNSITSSKDDVSEQSSQDENIVDDFIPSHEEIIYNPPPTPSQKSKYGNPDIEACLDIIKYYNDGVLNGSDGENRKHAKNLILKLKKMPKVLSEEMSWQDALNNILIRVVNNEYHSSKLGGPYDIYKNLGSLVQVAKKTKLPDDQKKLKKKKYVYEPEKFKDISDMSDNQRKEAKAMLDKAKSNLLKQIPN